MTRVSPPEAGPVGRALHRLAAALAVAGGLVLVALIVMTCLSIAGRAMFSAPLPGDFELVEIGCAVAVFAFLPYCQITGGNVVVDFFTARARPRTKAALDLMGKAHALLETLSESADKPPRSPR